MTAAVERRALRDSLVTRGTIGPEVSFPLRPSALGPGPAIVTSVAVKAGDTLREGDLLGTIVGRPVLAVVSPFPMYRELRNGLTGPDVQVLEEALARVGLLRSGHVDNNFDRATDKAVLALFRARGFEPVGPPPEESERLRELRATAGAAASALAATPPDAPPDERARAKRAAEDANAALAAAEQLAGPRVLPQEVVTVSQLPTRVTGIIAVGADLQASKEPLAEVAGGRTVVRVELLPATSSVAYGQDALIFSSEGASPVRARVERVDAASPANGTEGNETTDGATPPREVALLVPIDGLAPETMATNVRVEIVVQESREAMLVVPVTAVWTRPDGTSRVTRLGKNGRTVDLAVQPGFSAQGFVQVSVENDSLKEGDRVLVGR
ncbi:MAG: hypothetical protein ACRD1T_00290 [Acidimicrobiia bacterium]